MELLVGAMVYALIFQKLWTAARTDHELAKQGKISPRLEAKYGTAAAARAKVARYGFTDFLRDAYHDYWDRRGEALIAARTAEPAMPGERVRLKDRLSAAKRVVSRVAEKVRDSSVGRALIDPVGPAAPTPTTLAPPAPPVTLAEVPEGTRRLGDHGWEERRGGRWQPITPAAETTQAGKPQPAGPSTQSPAPNPGAPMSTPTGEAVNFRTAVAQVDALLSLTKSQLDQASAADRALASVDAAIDGMQQRQVMIATGTTSLAEHLAACGVDPTSISAVAAAADVLTNGVADQLMEHVEQLRIVIRRVMAACDAGIAALHKARKTLIGKYADAAAVVEEELKGNPKFLAGEDNSQPAQSARPVEPKQVDKTSQPAPSSAPGSVSPSAAQ